MKTKPAKPAKSPVEVRRSFKPPSASRQVGFHQLLVAARKKFLVDALSEALGMINQAEIKAQIAQYVPGDVQRLLAASGMRDEYVFPVPSIIKVKPALVGYYRLLLGAPQKAFYKGSTGMSLFKSMEEMGTVSAKQERYVPDFCEAMARPLAELVRQIPNFDERDLRELPLLTFGSQLQGSNNTKIGKKAMQEVFIAITEVLERHISKKEANRLTIKNAAGRGLRHTRP